MRLQLGRALLRLSQHRREVRVLGGLRVVVRGRGQEEAAGWQFKSMKIIWAMFWGIFCPLLKHTVQLFSLIF